MKKWYIHTMGYYSAMKRNGIEYFVEMHVGLCLSYRAKSERQVRKRKTNILC